MNCCWIILLLLCCNNNGRGGCCEHTNGCIDPIPDNDCKGNKGHEGQRGCNPGFMEPRSGMGGPGPGPVMPMPPKGTCGCDIEE